ncbi:NusG domain II-containing protein [Clostridium tarantellae]|uniref:NusG domain II-containing protein n=1 Tax=Clostridium tarantellae TaxID=39493 RepID=A0A6I1MMP3_9CLOT|nr:NusG domain II-containing protein [Clostridium tarantellae]MPQ44284.1 NusG domain II-containing protein [Clostridium tarantellae]
MRKKLQIGIIFIILIGAIAGYFFINNKKVENSVAKIYKDGNLIKTIDLNKVKEDYEVKIGDDEHFNIVNISKAGIKVVESNCPDKVCIKAGAIHDSLLPIACLPNNLIIKIEGIKQDEFDTKTY